jgi:hypothetical protein
VKVLFADVEITTIDPAFQDREEAFDGVGMSLGAVRKFARPFCFAVVYRIVPSKAAPMPR